MPLAPYQPQANPDQQKAPAALAELTVEQWALWRHHPVSALLLERYMPDFRSALERDTLNAWLAGNLTLQGEQDARGLIHCSQMIENLSLDQVRAFYGLPTFREQVEREKVRPSRPLTTRGY